MAMRKWSIIEEELRKAYPDPRLLAYLGEVHERLREQHQQIMALAEYIDKQSTLMQTMTTGMDQAQALINKLSQGQDMVKSIEGDPDETGSTYDLFRNRKN